MNRVTRLPFWGLAAEPKFSRSRRFCFTALFAVSVFAVVAITLSACVAKTAPTQPSASQSELGQNEPGQTALSQTSKLTGELTIFAAASLSASFTELAERFAAANPGVKVNPISFDGSATLVTQILEGAPADVFASADQANLQKVADRTDGAGAVFATNVLQIAVQPGNPKSIKSLADLTRADVTAVLCAPQVPCGSAAHKLFDLDGIQIKPASEEQNVKAVLTKVQLGEADAGLVYQTDVTSAAGSVDGIAITGADRAINSYPIAVLKDSKNAAAAKAFVAFVLSPVGQKILFTYGFGTP